MYQRNISISFGGPVTKAVKIIIIINIAVFLFQQILGMIIPNLMENLFGLSFYGLVTNLRVWQIFTYMFLHGGWLHIFFNLFALYMFGSELERQWGGRYFTRYYLLSGLGAGVFITLMNMITGLDVPTIGASGAIYALLLAYGMTWPNREVLLYFLFPVKMKYVVIGYGLLEFFGTINTVSGVAGNISHIGHLGGLFTGLLIMFLRRPTGNVYSLNSGGGIVALFKRMIQKHKNNKKREVISNRIAAKEIVDRLLEKIAREGISSLTPKEKAELEWARKNYYPDNNDIVH